MSNYCRRKHGRNIKDAFNTTRFIHFGRILPRFLPSSLPCPNPPCLLVSPSFPAPPPPSFHSSLSLLLFSSWRFPIPPPFSVPFLSVLPFQPFLPLPFFPSNLPFPSFLLSPYLSLPPFLLVPFSASLPFPLSLYAALLPEHPISLSNSTLFVSTLPCTMAAHGTDCR